MNTKTCTGCRETFPATLEYFNKAKKGKFGMYARCKTCRSEQSRKWRKENPEKDRERKRKWRKENPEKAKEQSRKWKKENPEKDRAHKRKWRKENLEKDRGQKRKWKKENPEKVKEHHKRMRQNAPCLIYRIVNTKTQTTYVGQTTTGKSRWYVHHSQLRNQKHKNTTLQEDWNEQGEEVSVFEIIEELPFDCSREILLKKEREQIIKTLREGKEIYNKII